MKKLIITLLLSFSVFLSKSQCITINSATFSNPSGDNVTWNMSVRWTAYGQQHFKAIVRNGLDTLLNICSEINRAGTSSGTFIYDSIITPGGITQLVATFKRYDGLCGSGISCGTDTTIIQSSPLNITFDYIRATNIGNTTKVVFKVNEVDERSYVTFNFTLPNGFLKRYRIYLPSKLKTNDIWEVVVDNINGTYTCKKL